MIVFFSKIQYCYTMFVPIALSITPSMMMLDHYQSLFSRPVFLSKSEYTTPFVMNTLNRIKDRNMHDYVTMLKLTNWLFYVQHMLTTNPNFIVENNKIECKSSIISIVTDMQSIMHKHGMYTSMGGINVCDVSYPFRHQMFINELLSNHRHQNTVYVTFDQLMSKVVSNKSLHVACKNVGGNRKLNMCGKRRQSRARPTRTYAKPIRIRFKI